MFISSQHIPSQLFKNFTQRAEKDLIFGILDHSDLADNYLQRRLSCYPFVGMVSQGKLITELMTKLWPDEFKDLIITVKSFESFLGGIRKRGHFIHQFEVFILGLNIIKAIEKLTNQNGHKPIFGDRKTIFSRWLMTSTVHDFGYPLEAANDLSKEIAKLYKTMGFHETSRAFFALAQQPKSSIGTDNKFTFPHEQDKSCFEKNISDFVLKSIQNEIRLSDTDTAQLKDALEKQANHGYVSAVLLGYYMSSSLLIKHGNWETLKEDTTFKSLGCCLSAIALHALSDKTEEKYIKKINFDANAMTYMLHLIDNIQEWSRGTVENYDKFPNYQLTSYTATDNLIKLEYFLQHDMWSEKMEMDTTHFLKKKEARIKLPTPPSTPLGLTILIEYRTNHGKQFNPITIVL